MACALNICSMHKIALVVHWENKRNIGVCNLKKYSLLFLLKTFSIKSINPGHTFLCNVCIIFTILKTAHALYHTFEDRPIRICTSLPPAIAFLREPDFNGDKDDGDSDDNADKMVFNAIYIIFLYCYTYVWCE